MGVFTDERANEVFIGWVKIDVWFHVYLGEIESVETRKGGICGGEWGHV